MDDLEQGIYEKPSWNNKKYDYSIDENDLEDFEEYREYFNIDDYDEDEPKELDFSE